MHKILVAEDNLPDALLIREVIRSGNLPLEMHLVSDGAAALDFILHSGDQGQLPELLILDLNLPKLEGFEVLEQVRAQERFRHIPALIVTSSDAAADRERAAHFGAHYFRKPPSYEEFLGLAVVLREILEKYGML